MVSWQDFEKLCRRKPSWLAVSMVVGESPNTIREWAAADRVPSSAMKSLQKNLQKY